METFLTTNGCGSLSDAERIDAIRAAEELSCTLSAAQAALAASLDASVRSERAARGVAAERRGRGVAEQVAHARRESPHRGRQHLGLARVTPTELPHTWAAWCAGRVTEWMVTLIAQETACLPLQHRMRVDESIAADPEVLETMSPQQVRGRCRAEAERLDPTAVLARRRYAETQRHVSIRPAPDTMTWVTALLPVKDGVSVYATLTRAADTARTTGDPRSRGQVMADTLVAATLQQPQPRVHDWFHHHGRGRRPRHRHRHRGAVASADERHRTVRRRARRAPGSTGTAPSRPSWPAKSSATP